MMMKVRIDFQKYNWYRVAAPLKRLNRLKSLNFDSEMPFRRRKES